MNIKYKGVETAIWSRKEGLSSPCFFSPWNSLKIDWPCTVCVCYLTEALLAQGGKGDLEYSSSAWRWIPVLTFQRHKPSTVSSCISADGSCSNKTLWVILFILFSFSYIPSLYLPFLNYGFSLTTHPYSFMTNYPRFFPCIGLVHSWIPCFVLASAILLTVLSLYLSYFIPSWQPP